MLAVTLGTVNLVLCNIAGDVFAYEDSCPHLANALSGGTLDGYQLTCAAHEWTFDLRRGCGLNPAHTRLRGFAVRIDGDTILVNVRAGQPPA